MHYCLSRLGIIIITIVIILAFVHLPILFWPIVSKSEINILKNQAQGKKTKTEDQKAKKDKKVKVSGI